MKNDMINEAVVFGAHRNLVGAITRTSLHQSDVAAILLTPGMLHHAGPYRLHVDIARAIAKQDILSLRFDLSGIGESLAVGAQGRSIDRAKNETSLAMDYLQERFGTRKFVLFGLCSGADDSVHTAVNDDRVVGLVTMDGCGYPTKTFFRNRIMHHYLPRILSPSKWVSVVRRMLSDQSNSTSSQLANDVREFPDRDEAAREFRALVDRRVLMHFIFTGGIQDYYNYEGQFWDMLPDVQWHGRATTSYYSDMDHVGLLCEDREKLVDEISFRIARIADLNQSTCDAEPTENPIILPLRGPATEVPNAHS